MNVVWSPSSSWSEILLEMSNSFYSPLYVFSIWLSWPLSRCLSYSSRLHFSVAEINSSFADWKLSAARQKLPLVIPEPLERADSIVACKFWFYSKISGVLSSGPLVGSLGIVYLKGELKFSVNLSSFALWLNAFKLWGSSGWAVVKLKLIDPSSWFYSVSSWFPSLSA